jgi:hypothetical protein
MVPIHGYIIALVIESIEIMTDPVLDEQLVVDPQYPGDDIALVTPIVGRRIRSLHGLIQRMFDTPKSPTALTEATATSIKNFLILNLRFILIFFLQPKN